MSDTGETAISPDIMDTAISSDTRDTASSPDTGDTAISPDTGDTAISSDTRDTAISPDTGDTAISPDTGDTVISPDTRDTVISPDIGVTTISKGTGDTAICPDTGDMAIYPDMWDRVNSQDIGDRVISPDLGDTAISPDIRDTGISPDIGDMAISLDIGVKAISPDIGDTAISHGIGDTAISPDIGDTAISPDIGDTAISPDIGDTAISSDIGDTTISPDIVDTAIAPDIGDTAISPDTGDTAISPDIGDTAIFENYVERILKQAKQSMNDKRYATYVLYINEFLKFFGTEKCFLVGSCAENTKLTWSKDDGDADFLGVSGKLSVPVKEIESRPDNPDFVWIRGEHLDLEHTLKADLIVDNCGQKYLPTSVLRDVDPRLFTFLRGILKFVGCTSDSYPIVGTPLRRTTTGTISKVGLERTQFRKLTIVDKEKIPQLRKYIDLPKRLPPRKSSEKQKQLSKEGYKFETLQKTLELFALFSDGGPTEERHSRFDHFTDVVKLLLGRWKAERDPVSVVSVEDDCGEDKNAICTENIGDSGDPTMDKTEKVNSEYVVNDFNLPTDVKATYKEKFMVDLVPALKIEGKLECMEEWYRRGGNWPSEKKLRDEIYNSDCYVIAKTAPFEEDQRNFCLAFNHAELKLAKSLTATQRTCYLLLKAYHKGIFVKTMEKIPTTHPLKTFHLKTVLYWVLESTGDTSMWWEENLIKALRNVLMYLQNSLRNRMLLHYFTGTNLFLCFETDICSALVAEIDKILKRPVACLQSFFDLENQGDIEVILTNDQVKCLIDMSQDGGVENEANVIENIMEDFVRGFQEAPKDENGDVLIKQAMDDVMQVVFEDGTNLRKEKTWIRKQRGPHSNTLTETPERFDAVLSMQDLTCLLGTLKRKLKIT